MDGRALALLAAALTLSAAMAEGMARFAGLHPREVRINRFFEPNGPTTWSVPDTELGWINKPGVAISVEDGNVPMTFWDFSRRASRPEPARNPGIPVMVIGGSNTQGYGVRDEDTFVWRIAAARPDLWIENFGTGGYGTVQAMMLAERALTSFYADEKPRLVLLGLDDAHVLRNVSDQSWIFSISDTKGRYMSPPHYRLVAGELRFHPFATIGYWPLELHSAAITAAHDQWIRRRYDAAAEAPAVSKRVLGQLADLAKRHGAVFAVAVLEDRKQITPELLADAAYPHTDCSGPGRSAPERYYPSGGGHPNAAMHAAYAACVEAWLGRVMPASLSPHPN